MYPHSPPLKQRKQDGVIYYLPIMVTKKCVCSPQGGHCRDWEVWLYFNKRVIIGAYLSWKHRVHVCLRLLFNTSGWSIYFSAVCKGKKCGFRKICTKGNDGFPLCICPQACSGYKHKLPVCGYSNGRQYNNVCELQKEECISGKTIGVMAGPCKSKVKVPVFNFHKLWNHSLLLVLFCYLFRKDFFLLQLIVIRLQEIYL